MFASAFILLLGLSAHAAHKTLADHRSLFEKELSKIDATHISLQKANLASYCKNLTVTKVKLQKTGDLEGTMATIQEIKRFEKEETVPPNPPDGFPSLLILVQKEYRGALQAADRAKTKNTFVLIKQYLVPLERLKKQLVRQGKMAEAQKVANEIKRVAFVLADIESKLPADKTTLAKPATTPSTGFSTSFRKGLVLYYSFDKDEGEKVTDKSGKKHHGKVEGGKWTRKSKMGGGYEFDGKDDYIDMSHHASDLGLSSGTICLWFRAHGEAGALYTAGSQNDINTRSYIYVGNMSVTMNNESLYFKSSSLGVLDMCVRRGHDRYLNNTWHHVAVVVDGKHNTLYVDGARVKSPFQHGTSTTAGIFLNLRNIDRFLIGKDFRGPRFFKGSVDEVLIFNRALSTQEIQKLYDSQK